MKDKENLINAFSELAPRYERVVDSELNRFWGWSYHGFIDQLLSSSPIDEQDVILDVATGTGVIPGRLIHAGHARDQVHALDITLSMLRHASRRLEVQDGRTSQNLVCASAMEMPYTKSAFSLVICGLATHHMKVEELVQECHRVLRSGGRLAIADAGGSRLWKIPGVKFLLRLAAFIYFSLVENKSRAWAETGAVSNVHSKEEWDQLLAASGFREIAILRLKSRFFWVPAPLLINAKKIGEKIHE